MMAVVRATPPEGESPWLIPQVGSNTRDPMSATYWRDKEMSGVQMMAGRQNLLKEYPMNARFMMSINSYASRRAGSNLLALMGGPAVIRNAHGNWKTDSSKSAGSGMADVYTKTGEWSAQRLKPW